MSKILKVLGVTVAALAVTFALSAAVKAPDEIVIDAAKDKRAAVTFPHEAHAERVESCVTCHHTSEGLTASSGQNVESCTSCHLDPKEAATPGMREMSLKKNPFHMACIDCHKAETKGPTKCDDCHPKG
jgi:hypothetical protein